MCFSFIINHRRLMSTRPLKRVFSLLQFLDIIQMLMKNGWIIYWRVVNGGGCTCSFRRVSSYFVLRTMTLVL